MIFDLVGIEIFEQRLVYSVLFDHLSLEAVEKERVRDWLYESPGHCIIGETTRSTPFSSLMVIYLLDLLLERNSFCIIIIIIVYKEPLGRHKA